MKNACKRLGVIVFFFMLPFISFSWGVLGHRITGEIADSYLTPKAKITLAKILGNETIAMSSNWADFIKSDSTYDSLNSWHYINLDSGLTRNQVQAYLANDTATNIYTKVNYLIRELKKKQMPIATQRKYIKLLIHFIGDIHQPMHAARKSDFGGNRVRVQWFNNATNLHAVWDESLINFQQLSYTEYTRAINFTSQQQRMAWQKQPVSEWIIESYLIAQELYSGIKEPNQRLSYDYNFDHIRTLNERLLKGGVRLAGVLNQLFG